MNIFQRPEIHFYVISLNDCILDYSDFERNQGATFHSPESQSEFHNWTQVELLPRLYF